MFLNEDFCRSEPRTIAWPFKCEPPHWSAWGCVVDTAIGIPGSEFVAFYEGCLGRIGCHPDATGDKAAANAGVKKIVALTKLTKIAPLGTADNPFPGGVSMSSLSGTTGTPGSW